MATISDRIAWVLVPSFLSVVYASAPGLAQNFLAETTHSRNFRAYAAGHELTTPNYSDFFAFENPLELRSVGAVISAAGNLIAYDDRELRVIGETGSYVSKTVDIQAQDIFAGKRPTDDLVSWGYEPEANWGTLRNAEGTVRIPSEQGRYHDYYSAFAACVRDGTPPPVTAETGARTLAILDAARQSAAEGRSILL
ncbi:Gfo/Idh/MocA family oxidoreductase [Roseobacter sp. HKCC-CH-9208]|uniref:Gfo/Idh/MocA family oxidoreductase n=1 Tax=Roseobacter sp. HKCC-CH-9208 TaxID=3120339 RepID=UPI0030EF61CC